MNGLALSSGSSVRQWRLIDMQQTALLRRGEVHTCSSNRSQNNKQLTLMSIGGECHRGGEHGEEGKDLEGLHGAVVC